jgi:glutamate:GABA antiporter
MKKLSLSTLVILMIAAIDNMRNLPAAALFGSSMIFFFVISALIFLIPTALVSAELSATFPEKGGVYQWVNRAFGQRWAMAAIWLQWINTMVWYPTILSFIAGTLAYLIDPALAENRGYLLGTILVTFWGLTLLNLRGIHTSARINTLFCSVGTMLPLLFLIFLGVIWVSGGHPLQISIGWDNLIPPLGQTTSWVSLIAIMASFLGMELSGVHVNDIDNPKRNFPRAALLATLFIFLSMLFGSLAIAFVLPMENINLISGVMQVFSSFFMSFGLEWLTPYLAILIVVGSVGTMINWLISPAKGLLHAAEYGFLPSFFTKYNKAGAPANILMLQAILVTFFCLLLFIEPNINSFYWFLTALSTELYMIMYLLMFGAAIKLRNIHPNREDAFQIPGGVFGILAVCLLGLIGCCTTIIVSFIPPEHVIIENPLLYVYLIGIGNLVTISPLLFFYFFQKKSKNATIA